MKLRWIAVAIMAMAALAPIVHADPPLLTVSDKSPLPSGQVSPGTPLAFNLNYKGDPPTTLLLVIESPDGQTLEIPAAMPAGDPGEGVQVTWEYTPKNPGLYHYYFEAGAGDLGSVRFPQEASDDFTFDSVNLVLKWGIFALGAFVALLILPFVIHNGVRTANKNGDPSASARVAVLIGIAAAYVFFVYLFLPIYHMIGAGIGAGVTIALLVGLFSRR